MSLQLETVKLLKTVYRPAFEFAEGRNTLFEAGLINLESYEDDATLVYRRQKNPGGTLAVRAAGENIQSTDTGLDYIDETANTYGFADGESTIASNIYGLKDPESLNPEQQMAVNTIATMQMNVLMVKLANTLRLMASLCFLGSITIGGTTFNNSKVHTSYSLSPSGGWDNASTDIIGQLITTKKDFNGTDKGVGSMTVLLRMKQVHNMMKNTGIINAIGFDNGAGLATSNIPFSRIQTLFATYGIYLIVWEDAYYSASNSNPYDNISYFLDANTIVLIPGAYFVRSDVNPFELSEVTPKTGVAPFADLIVVADPDFKNKKIRAASSLPSSIGTIPGAYVFSGFREVGPDTPDVYQSFVATKMGIFLNPFAAVKNATVQS